MNRPSAALIEFLALTVVLSAALYLLALAIFSFLKPQKASRFLLGFASSAYLHHLELFIRIIVGAALLVRAPLMMLPVIFTVFGWVLVGTSVCLFFIPWRWHQEFAQQAVPKALRYLKLVAAVSFVLGGFIIVSAMLGSTA